MEKKLEIAVIGAGAISGSHIGALTGMEDAKVTAVADIVLNKAEKLAAGYSIKAYSDYKKMLDEEKPDIAVITLPHFLHRQAAVDCAERGCNILLEKPMAMDEQECDDIIEICGAHEVKLMVGHIQHFDNRNNYMREMIQSKLLGELIMITNVRYCNYFAPSRPDWFLHKKTAGGGIVTSHIKPWCYSDNRERLDIFNGLLLVPNLDSLFDDGLISFNNKGKIIISNLLDDRDRNKLGIHPELSIRKVEYHHMKYLEYHRRNIFRVAQN